jgi:hypothetical protein
MKTAATLVGLAMVAGAANAGLFTESESNNTLATANFVGSFGFPGGSAIIDGTISQGDVDWFSFTLTNTASLAVFAGFGTAGADGVMQIVSGTDVIAFNDDDGVGNMPALQIDNLAAGTYFVGMSGFGDAFSDSVGSDELFDGGQHTENFAYKLTMGFTVVPSPASVAMLGFGGLAMVRRRR